jgi:RNAse (barnase) inhibitor barstar
LSSSGPLFPSGASGTTNAVGGGTRTWANPGNIGANDGNLASASFLAAAATSDDLIGSTFGFSIPSTAVIDGILLEIRYQDIGGGGGITESIVKLFKGGVIVGSNKSTGATLPGSLATVSYGGAADLWGTTWTPTDINATNFAVAFVVSSSGGIDTAGVDFFRITITYHNVFSDGITLTATASSTVTPANTMHSAMSTSATIGISITAKMTMPVSLAMSNTAGMSDTGVNIPGTPSITLTNTAGAVFSAATVMGVSQMTFSSTANFIEVGSAGLTRGFSVSASPLLFMNATVGGSPLVVADDYTNLVTSEHNKRPNFMAMIAQDVQGYVDNINLLRTFSNIFDIDQAAGQQLDMIGVWVGVSRNISTPLTGVYFAFDTALVGFNQGNWFGIGDATAGLTRLGDLDYLLLLKAKIASNHWDGTIPNAYAIWAIVFAGQPFVLLIQDGQDMTMAIIVIGVINTAVTLSLITNGYIALRPAGVLITGYYQNTVPNFPVFGFGPESATLAGFNDGAWVKKIG